MFLSDEVVPVIRILALTTVSNKNAGKRTVDHIASNTMAIAFQSPVDQTTCMNLPVSIMHAPFSEDPQRNLIGKNTEPISRLIKNELSIKKYLDY